MSISVCLISSDDISRQNLSEIFRAAGLNVVGSYGNVEENVIEDLVPDTLVVMHGQNFDEQSDAITKWKSISSSARIAVLAETFDLDAAIGCFELGAEGYIVRSKNASAMIAALRLVAAGERSFPSKSIAELDRHRPV